MLLQYFLKLSVSLSIIYLFYYFILRRLTFYYHNRWYLTGYSLLCFFIALININPFLLKNQLLDNKIVTAIPTVHELTATDAMIAVENNDSWSLLNWAAVVFIVGFAVLIARLIIQYISFRRIKNNAELITDGDLKVYQVNKTIIPFSFGRSIFINHQQHDEQELKEIIRHEFVHVKQRHTIDILWGEIVCALNWYNPFAWMIRRAIRQNLEFIADNNVLESGVDKKQYQYLLLKVIGVSQFSIANQFNFSSLKKRIVMMNKIKSARVQLLKSLFVLPVIAMLLLAFRSQVTRSVNGNNIVAKSSVTDTVPQTVELRQLRPLVKTIIVDSVREQTIPNEKGFFIDIKDRNGHCTVVVKDVNNKPVKEVDLLKWNGDLERYESLYGEIPPVPVEVSLTPVTVANAEVATPIVTTVPLTKTILSVPAQTTVVSGSSLSEVPLTTTVVLSPLVATGTQVKIRDTVVAGEALTVSNSILATTAPVVEEAITPAEKIMELKIYRSTKKEDLDKLITQAKQNGVELEFDNTEFNDKGQLVSISGKMKKGDGTNTFTATDFVVVRLILYKTAKGNSMKVIISEKGELS